MFTVKNMVEAEALDLFCRNGPNRCETTGLG